MTMPPIAQSSDASASSPLPGTYGPSPAQEAPVVGEPDWTARRRASPLNDLLNPTLRWAASLPPAIRPMALLNRFPRLANLVAASWKEPLSFRACIDDLLTDRRGGRQGLPPDVRDELENVRRYYYFREFPEQAGPTVVAKSTN